MEESVLGTWYDGNKNRRNIRSAPTAEDVARQQHELVADMAEVKEVLKRRNYDAEGGDKCANTRTSIATGFDSADATAATLEPTSELEIPTFVRMSLHVCLYAYLYV